jgi:hypothetical protein
MNKPTRKVFAMRGKPKTIPMPTEWRDNFKAYTLRTNFALALTRPMMEFLCAVADDVHWDRLFYGSDMSRPDCFLVSEKSLEKRGLIMRKPKSEMDKMKENRFQGNPAFSMLTPAGALVVELLKISGMFVEADAAIEKKAKRKA